MDEREIVCSRCENSTIMTRDSVQSGWVLQEPGWALVSYANLCPRCNRRLLRNNREINKRKEMYPMVEIKED